MNRLVERGRPILLATIAILAVSGSVVIVAGMLWPDQTGEEASGVATLEESIRDQLDSVTAMTGLEPVMDLGLLVGSYVLVCLFLWAQNELRSYLDNRSHYR